MTTGRVVLITGCSKGGIGAALAEEFARNSCKVYATARDVNKLEGVSGVEKLALDVLDAESVKQGVGVIMAQEGRIDILVNNAGVGCTGAMLDLPTETVDHAFQTNVLAVLRVIQAVAPIMAAQKSKGIIVNMGSIGGFIAAPWGGTYGATKAAIHSFSDCLDMELRPLGVKLILLAPGNVKSNIGVNQTASHVPAPSDTLYGPRYRPNINARLTISQGPTAMPTAEFAKQTVRAILKPNPPSYMSIGTSSWVAYILSWLPRSTRLNLIWKMYSKPLPS